MVVECIKVADIFLRQLAEASIEGGNAAQPAPEVAPLRIEKFNLFTQRE